MILRRTDLLPNVNHKKELQKPSYFFHRSSLQQRGATFSSARPVTIDKLKNRAKFIGNRIIPCAPAHRYTMAKASCEYTYAFPIYTFAIFFLRFIATYFHALYTSNAFSSCICTIEAFVVH